MSNQNTKPIIRVKKEKDLMPKGAAGTPDDPLLEGLKKKGRTRYRRFLREGMQPEEARVRAKDPSAYAAAIKKKNVSSPAVASGKRKRKAPSPAKTVATKRTKKSPVLQEPIDVAILATGYPLRLLTKEEATKVEEALVTEMMKGCSHSINFAGIHFRDGLIIVKCRDDRSKQWLELTVPKVLVIDKLLLRTCPEDDLPSLQIVTVHLPGVPGQKTKAAVRLLREQNKDLDSDTWALLNTCGTSTGGKFLTLGLKPEALELLQKNGMEMSYRFEQLPCQLQTVQPEATVEENALWYVDIPEVRTSNAED